MQRSRRIKEKNKGLGEIGDSHNLENRKRYLIVINLSQKLS